MAIAVLLLSLVNCRLARRADRRREDLQRRIDDPEADRLLDQAGEALWSERLRDESQLATT